MIMIRIYEIRRLKLQVLGSKGKGMGSIMFGGEKVGLMKGKNLIKVSLDFYDYFWGQVG